MFDHMANNTKNKSSNHELELDEANNKIEKLEAELLEIRNRFGEAESIAKFGCYELDPVTFNVIWTEGLFKILGYNSESGYLKNYFDNKKIMHLDDWDKFNNGTQALIKTGKDFEMDVRAKKPDGSILYIHIITKAIKDENGKIKSIRGTAQDITYLKKIESDLKESETFYKTLFENTGTASIIVNENETILMANSKFLKLSGYSKEEVEDKKTWKKMFSKEYLELIGKYHYMRKNNVGNPPEIYEAQLTDVKGNERVILINAAIIPGTKKTIISIQDITERKKAEMVLQTTLKRFYTILGNMRASVLLVTEENKIEFANQAFCDYFDLNEAPEALRGLTADEMIKKIKNVYEYPNEEISRIKDIVSSWMSVIGEEIYIKGGRACLRDFIPIFVGEKPYGRLWLHLDITERKKIEKELADSERRYRYIVEKATAGMFILDEKGIIKYLNEYMALMLDYSKSEMLERHINNFVHDENDFYMNRKLFEMQIEKYDKFKLLDKKGKIFWSNLTVSPIFNSKKEYTGLLGIATDINTHKGLEEAFLEREEILTDIIYDMVEMLNNFAKDKNKPEFNEQEFNSSKNLDNN